MKIDSFGRAVTIPGFVREFAVPLYDTLPRGVFILRYGHFPILFVALVAGLS